MRPACPCFAASRGKLKKHKPIRPGVVAPRLVVREVPNGGAVGPRRREPAYLKDPRSLKQVHKLPTHPVLPPLAARVVARLPSPDFDVDLGRYTPRDPALPVLRGAHVL